MFGNSNNGVSSGPMLMLKAMGFDPDAIMQNVESAKVTAQQVMSHFDKRLIMVEQRQEEILVMLNEVVGLLRDPTTSNTTTNKVV